MIYLYLLSAICLIISFFVDKKKSFSALEIAWKKWKKIAPSFLIMITLVSIALSFVTDELISSFLTRSNHFWNTIIALGLGSISIMPGFIAFPLVGILSSKGVPYFVLAGFTTTLMMVGIVTFPVEQKFLGAKVTILRNLVSLGIAVIILLVIGLFFGEI